MSSQIPGQVKEALRQVRRGQSSGRTYFCIVDVIKAINLSAQSRVYWAQFKRRETFQMFPKLKQLKLHSGDGKLYWMDMATVDELSLILGSIASVASAPYRFLSPGNWYWLLTGEDMPTGIRADQPERDDDNIDAIYLGDLCNLLDRSIGKEAGPFIFCGNLPSGHCVITDDGFGVVAIFDALDKRHLVVRAEKWAAYGWSPDSQFKDLCRDIRARAAGKVSDLAALSEMHI